MSFPGTHVNILKFEPVPYLNNKNNIVEVKTVKITQTMNYKHPEQVHYMFKSNQPKFQPRQNSTSYDKMVREFEYFDFGSQFKLMPPVGYEGIRPQLAMSAPSEQELTPIFFTAMKNRRLRTKDIEKLKYAYRCSQSWLEESTDMTSNSSNVYRFDKAILEELPHHTHRYETIKYITSRFDSYDEYHQLGTSKNPNVNVRPGMLTKVYAYRIIERYVTDKGAKIQQYLCLTSEGFIKPPQLLIDCMRITNKGNRNLICPIPHRDYTIYLPMYMN